MFEFDYEHLRILILQTVILSFAIFGAIDLLITVFLMMTKEQRNEWKRKREEKRKRKEMLLIFTAVVENVIIRETKRMKDSGTLPTIPSQPVWICDGEPES